MIRVEFQPKRGDVTIHLDEDGIENLHSALVDAARGRVSGSWGKCWREGTSWGWASESGEMGRASSVAGFIVLCLIVLAR